MLNTFEATTPLQKHCIQHQYSC